jgi:Tfp pilus assembly protein FimT
MSTPVMTPPTENQSPRERSWIYVTACVILGVLVIWGIFAFSSARETKRAQDKADQLISALQDAGYRTPDRDQIVRVLGDDGGATCDNPNKALGRATLLALLANGATGPGARPVIADSRAVQGQLLIMKIYCPGELEDFQQFVEDLKTGDVASQ